MPASVVDHIATRPRSPYPTAADHLDNLRSLCRMHDAQIKELASGIRRHDGNLAAKGCDNEGWPLG